jgi:flagellin FlaB
MFEPGRGIGQTQRGITGLETAIILIAFVVVASVFAFTVLSTGIFSSERSKETVHAGLDEVRSSLEPRGSVTAFKGRYGSGSGTETIYKVSIVVAQAVAGEPLDLTPPYSADGASTDPDIVTGAQNKTIVTYSDTNEHLSDVPWTITWLGYSNGDNILDPGEKAEMTVWLFDRLFAVSDPDSDNSIGLMNGSSPGGSGGLAATSTAPGVNDRFTFEIQPPTGAVLTIERTLPARMNTVMDLR